MRSFFMPSYTDTEVHLLFLVISRKEEKMYFDLVATGKRIRGLRKENKLTQEKLAEKLNISRVHMANIEIGDKAPSIDLLIVMAEFFGVTLDYLVLGR